MDLGVWSRSLRHLKIAIHQQNQRLSAGCLTSSASCGHENVQRFVQHRPIPWATGLGAPSPDVLTARQGIWPYAQRVPAAFAEVDPRGVIRQFTETRAVDDPRKVRARCAAQKINDELETFWRASLGGSKANAQARNDQARIMARRLGFERLGAAEVARLPMDEIPRRVEALACGLRFPVRVRIVEVGVSRRRRHAKPCAGACRTQGVEIEAGRSQSAPDGARR